MIYVLSDLALYALHAQVHSYIMVIGVKIHGNVESMIDWHETTILNAYYQQAWLASSSTQRQPESPQACLLRYTVSDQHRPVSEGNHVYSIWSQRTNALTTAD